MDNTYFRAETQDNSKKWLGIFLLFLLVVVIASGIFYFVNSRKKVVSPVPAKPSFEVVFYTPSPAVTIPSTPSATLKPGQKPSVTAKPTIATGSATKATVTPTGKNSPTPTKKATPTATKAPTATPKN